MRCGRSAVKQLWLEISFETWPSNRGGSFNLTFCVCVWEGNKVDLLFIFFVIYLLNHIHMTITYPQIYKFIFSFTISPTHS